MSQLLALYMGSLILRSIGIALIAAVCSWKIRNVAIRHAVWVGVLGSLLLMPVVDYLLPASWVPARIQRIAAEQPVNFHIVSARAAGAPQPHAPTTTPVALPAQSKPVDLWNVAATLYALVAFAMFIRLALGYRKIRRLRRAGRTIASPVWEEVLALHRSRWHIPALLESEAVQVPMTVGFIRPVIVLPADWKTWDDWKMRAALLHEIAHVGRCDWAIAAIAATSKCAYWLNPLAWFLERNLSQLAEQATDDATLSSTQDATRYAEILLEFATATQNGGRFMKGGVAMAQRNMKTRIERVLGNPQSGTGIMKIAGWALVMLVAVPVIYSAAAIQVTSDPVKLPVSAYAAEFGRLPTQQTPAGVTQASPSPVPASGAKIQHISPDPAADPQISYEHWEAEYQKLLRNLEVTEQTFQMLQKYDQFNGGPATGPQASAKIGSVEFLQEEAKRLEKRLGELNSTIPQKTERVSAVLEAVERSIAEIDKLVEAIESTGTSRGEPATNSRNRVFVTGRVQKPGDFGLSDPLTVLQALALAGGFQDYAKTDAISIIRMNGDSSTLFQFNYSNVIKGVNTSQNIYLENGDVVVVP